MSAYSPSGALINEITPDDDHKILVECTINMLNDLGFVLDKSMRILDFGCGNGELVQAFLAMGYDAYGVDIIDCPLSDDDHFGKIEFHPYRIPYDNDFFDFVISSSVFEHTMNTEECFREVYRVLKPNGATLHSIPSRYRLLEPHIYVPFGAVIQSPIWLKMWAFLRIRNEYQETKSWREVYASNLEYCKTGINYLKYKNLKKMILSIFGNIRPVKNEFIKFMPGGAAKVGRILPIPGYAQLIFLFRQWEIYMRKIV